MLSLYLYHIIHVLSYIVYYPHLGSFKPLQGPPDLFRDVSWWAHGAKRQTSAACLAPACRTAAGCPFQTDGDERRATERKRCLYHWSLIILWYYRLHLSIVVLQIHIIHIYPYNSIYINNVCLRDSRFIGWGLSYFVQWWIIVMVFTEHLHWWTGWLLQWAVLESLNHDPSPSTIWLLHRVSAGRDPADIVC